MPTIPNGLQPTVDGYSVGAPEGVMRTEVGGGLPRYGLDWDQGKQLVQVSLRPLTPLEFSVWSAFFHQVIDKGAIAFDMPLDTGLGSQTHSVNIVPGTYAASRDGELTRVSFTVETTSAVYGLSPAAAQAIVDDWNGAATVGTPSIPLGFRPVIESYSLNGPGGVARSSVPGGAARYGMTFDRGYQQFRVTLILDTAEKLKVWLCFVLRSVAKGCVSFTMPLDSGFGSQSHLVNIAPGTHSITRRGALAVASFVVEAESMAYDFTAADAEDLIDVYNYVGSETSALFDRIARFANVDTLVLQ